MVQHIFRNRKAAWVGLVFMACLGMACNLFQAIATSTPTTLPAMQAPATTAAPTMLQQTVPWVTVQPSAVTIPPSPTVTAAQQVVQIFLIALDDQGVSGKLVGCGDSAVPVVVNIPPTQGVLREALAHLLSLKDQFYGQSGLYNALYQSNLSLEDVRIENGQAIIQLSGQLRLGGVCDNPRVEAQLVETALQFATVKNVVISVNGRPLKEVLSEAGQ